MARDFSYSSIGDKSFRLLDTLDFLLFNGELYGEEFAEDLTVGSKVIVLFDSCGGAGSSSFMDERNSERLAIKTNRMAVENNKACTVIATICPVTISSEGNIQRYAAFQGATVVLKKYPTVQGFSRQFVV